MLVAERGHLKRNGEHVAKFFVPAASTPELSEKAFAAFVKTSPYPLLHPSARLFRFSFPHLAQRGRVQICVAQVGKDITNWPEPAGTVLAIVETTDLVLIHTVGREALAAGPLMVGAREVAERVYFDDYPASPSGH